MKMKMMKKKRRHIVMVFHHLNHLDIGIQMNVVHVRELVSYVGVIGAGHVKVD
jgi:hypothetical protein